MFNGTMEPIALFRRFGNSKDKHLRLIFVVLAAFWVTPAQAASFNCTQAATDIEIAICSDPDLSRLDEEMAEVYGQLSVDSRYFPMIQRNQRNWLGNDRSADPYVFQQRLNYLQAYMALATCFDGADDPRSCLVNEQDALDHCMNRGGYTTVAMDSCAAAMAGAWDTIMAVETEVKQTALSNDIDTLVVFDEASEAFDTYRQTECGWQYSEYRHGTIRGQIWFGCYLELTSRRVISLIYVNQTN